MGPHEIIERHAARTRRRLPTHILPYWLAVSRDDEAGGYLLPDDVRRSPAHRAALALVDAVSNRWPR